MPKTKSNHQALVPVPPSAPPPPSEPTPQVVLQELPGEPLYIYSNYIDITWTALDIKIRFAESRKFDRAKLETTVSERVVVTLAWAEAKALQTMLQESLSVYEKVNGTIKTMPDLKCP